MLKSLIDNKLAACVSIFFIILSCFLVYRPQIIIIGQSKPILSYKLFDKADCKRHFTRDLIAKGYQPIYIKIINDTDKTFVFSTNNVSIPLVSGDEVARKIKKSVVGRAVGYGFASLIFWPFAIPAIIDTVNASDANKQMKSDAALKELRNQIIEPHSTISGILFVFTADSKRDFCVTLTESKTGKRIDLKSMIDNSTF